MDFNHLVLFPADAYLVESFAPQIVGDLRPELVCRLVRHWLARLFDLGIDLKTDRTGFQLELKQAHITWKAPSYNSGRNAVSVPVNFI